MIKFIYKIFLGLYFFNSILYADDLIESQPEIIFQFEKLEKSQENLALQVDFNKAVLHLSKNAVPDYEFLFPGEDLVTAYESFTSPFFKEINRNISEKRVMETLHETLLPELMSGRLSRE